MTRSFYLGAAVTIALVVAVGFGQTVNASLFHPLSPRPRILYLHAALFTAWVLLFITQAALVRSRRVAWHRRLGREIGLLVAATGELLGRWRRPLNTCRNPRSARCTHRMGR